MPIWFIFGIYFKRLFGFFLKCTPAFETKFKNKFSRKCPVYFPVTLFCFNWSVFYNIEDSLYIKVSKFFLYIHLKTLTLNFVPLFFFYLQHHWELQHLLLPFWDNIKVLVGLHYCFSTWESFITTEDIFAKFFMIFVCTCIVLILGDQLN